MHLKEQERVQKQSSLEQQLQHCCFEQDGEHFGGQLSVSMDKEHEENVSVIQIDIKVHKCMHSTY